jgi:hypothetical protein
VRITPQAQMRDAEKAVADEAGVIVRDAINQMMHRLKQIRARCDNELVAK